MDIISRMIEAMPVGRLTLSDPMATSWVIIQATKASKNPADPAYNLIATAMAQLIKSERLLRAEPALLALAEEVLGKDNVMMTPHAVAQALEAQLNPIRKARA